MVHRLILEDLGLQRGGRALVAGLSLVLRAGEALVVTGPNGAGKSTLLRTIAGFLPAERGSIVFEGWPADVPVAALAHWVGHQDALKRSLSVAENLDFWARYLGGRSDASGIEAALLALDLAPLADTPVAYLSAGQRRRAGLARLLVAPRPLWLLDEPTSALDERSARLVAGIIDAHRRRGGLVVVATHQPLGIASPRTLAL
jgi:heme exporter protein A